VHPQTLAYLSLAFVFAFTPGATTAVVIRHTLEGGRRRGLTASAGAMTASAIQATLAVMGVGALLIKWPLGLKVLATAGVIFLGWVGVKSLRSAFGLGQSAKGPTGQSAGVRQGSGGQAGAPFKDGFTINIFNPSITSFYVGVTPTFLVPSATWRSLAMLYLAHISIAFTCHVFWSSLFNQARTFFAGERPRRWLDGIVGVILIWLAIGIIRTI
jgi:threonine/homoserine/homoserine lactone efflux protein